jgi:hypothetical protein
LTVNEKVDDNAMKNPQDRKYKRKKAEKEKNDLGKAGNIMDKGISSIITIIASPRTK